MTADPEITQVDGILFSYKKGAVMTGHLTDRQESDAPINRSSNAHDSWFYLHVKNVVSDKKCPTTELIPLARVPFPVRSWALLGRSPCFRPFQDAFQPLHTLVARRISAHLDDLRRIAWKWAIQETHNSGLSIAFIRLPSNSLSTRTEASVYGRSVFARFGRLRSEL